MIIGQSGSGKSTSGENLDPKSTVWVNVLGKSLPFKGWKSNYVPMNKDNPNGNLINSSDAVKIANMIKYVSDKMPHIKTIVIDDFQHSMSLEYAERINEKGFQKFQDIFQNTYNIIKATKEAREDLYVIFLMHPETEKDANGVIRTKALTVGKAVDQYLNLESMFTIVLYTNVKKTTAGTEYLFQTQNDGNNTCKSPKGMFDPEIPNDLKLVINKIEEYNK